MQEENDERLREQYRKADQAELSNVWRELLGLRPGEDGVPGSSVFSRQVIPTLEGDPWMKLLEAENIELLDLQQVHLPISEGEVDEVLQLMQEQAAQDQSEGKDPKN